MVTIIERQTDKPSRAQANRAARLAKQHAEGHAFPLTHTGGEALLRRLDLMDAIALDLIPNHLTGTVDRMLAAMIGEDGTGTAELSTRDLFAALGGATNAVRAKRALADAVCFACFVDPVLVPTAADITDPETQQAIDEIDLRDRDAVFDWVQNQEAAEAAAVTPVFPQPAADVTPITPVESLPRPEPVRLVAGHANGV